MAETTINCREIDNSEENTLFTIAIPNSKLDANTEVLKDQTNEEIERFIEVYVIANLDDIDNAYGGD